MVEEDAHQKRFISSPIRSDGVDLEGPKPKAIGYGCRVYSEISHTVGWPSLEQIRSARQSRSPPNPQKGSVLRDLPNFGAADPTLRIFLGPSRHEFAGNHLP